MSYQDAYLPDGFGAEYEQTIRREEAYDLALAAKEVDLWASAIDPLVADDMALHGECGADNLGSLLCLAAYAKSPGGRGDLEHIRDRLILLFERDIDRLARYEVSKEGY